MPFPTPDAHARADALKSLLRTPHQRNQVDEAVTAADGRWDVALDTLKRKLPSVADRLTTADALVGWAGDHPAVMRALGAQRQLPTLRELALDHDVDSLAGLLDPAEPVPARRATATTLRRGLFRAEPTAVLRNMLVGGEVPAGDQPVRAAVVDALAGAADFDIRTTPVHAVTRQWDPGAQVPAEVRQAAIRQLGTLQRIVAISPVPEAVAFLAGAGVPAAASVAQVPRAQFVRYAESEGLEPEIAQQVHAAAVRVQARNEAVLASLRDTVTGSGIALVDDAASRDERLDLLQAKFDAAGAGVTVQPLFADLDTCACDDCRSVYSPAAYFVELLQYLRNNNLDPRYMGAGIDGSALAMLLRRRPDLADLELTCENTFTVLPYLDLATEVMESFTVHLADYRSDGHVPKQAVLEVFNVEDETSAELQAQPQHVNYQAYCELKSAVRPFALPYHQPIDRERIWLKYLGTSRFEVLDTFRTATEWCEEANLDDDQQAELTRLHGVAIDRAVQAEYLGLTQEQYIHLTGQAFWPREYFDLTTGTQVSEDDYRAKIGVRPVPDYYGYDAEAGMLDQNAGGLTFVAAQLLPRTGVTYVELSDLLRTRYVNPAYPTGAALRLTEAVKFRYRQLQGLVDTSTTDPRRRFGPLVDFLVSEQPDLSRDDVYEWARCSFEQIGELIVLDAPGVRRLPLHGYLAVPAPVIGLLAAVAPAAVAAALPVPQVPGATIQWRLTAEGVVTPVILGVPDGLVTDAGLVTDSSGAPLGGGGLLVLDDTGAEIGTVGPTGAILDLTGKQFTWMLLDECDLAPVRLTHLDGTAVTTAEYGRIHRFIRLWRATGWTILATDQALTGLSTHPATGADDTGDCGFVRLDGFAEPPGPCAAGGGSDDPPCPPVPAPTEITVDVLAQFVALRRVVETTGLPLDRVLSFWADMSTAGDPSLYTRVFGAHNVVAIDSVFRPDADGNVLAAAGTISDHIAGLQAALGLSATDLATIVQWRALPDELTLSTATELFRHAVLAKYLRVKIPALVEVVAVFGDPFASAGAAWQFLTDWQVAADAGLGYRQLDYLLRDHDDPLRPLAPSRVKVLRTTKTLYDGLAAVDAAHPDLPADGFDQATDELLRSQAALVFGPTVVDSLIGLCDGTTVYATNAPAGLAIAVPDDLAAVVAYGDRPQATPPAAVVRVTGILTPEALARAKTLSALPAWAAALDRAVAQPRRFFTDTLQALFTDPAEAATTLLAGDSNPPSGPGATAPTSPGKRLYLLRALLPQLRARLAHKLVVETLAGESGLDTDVTDTLLSDVLVVGARSAVDVLLGLRQSGPAGSGWHGYLLPPVTGAYTFVVTGSDTQPTPLTLDGAPVPLPHQQEDPNNVWSSDPVPLAAGTLHQLDTGGAVVSQLQWRTATAPTMAIPTSALLPSYAADGVDEVFARVAKAAILVDALSLSADESAYLHSHGADFGGFSFNQPTLSGWRRAHAYAMLRDALRRADGSLLDLFGWATRTPAATPTEVAARVADATGWDAGQITMLIAAEHFDLGSAGAFRNETNLARLQAALGLAAITGASVAQLFAWADPGSQFWPRHRIATDIQAVMRARFVQDDWEQAVRPLYDELRDHQRQALIGYLVARPELFEAGVTDADGLFEFFLIDPQMGACRDTSRIKQAISSVQTFVQRCLLGLEAPDVPADLFDRERWEWMQKYVLWEANREVFVTPWRWAREELRDTQSPFFRELAAKLLQKDISPDTVTEAVRAYVVSLDQVANLEPIGLFEDESADATQKVLHVFARTRTSPQQHWSRRYGYQTGYWSPWEHVEVDIPGYDVETDSKITGNGSYLIPTVIQGRLVVLWPIFARKSIPAKLDDAHNFEDFARNTHPAASHPVEYWEVKLAFSEYRNGKWSQKQVTTGALTVRERSHETDTKPPVVDGYFLPGIANFQFIPRLSDSDPRLVVDCYVYVQMIGDIDSQENFGSFALDGSHLYVANPSVASVLSSGVGKTSFHYETGPQPQLHSLQVGAGQTAPGLVGQPPYFEETADRRVDFQPAGGTLVPAYPAFAHELLGRLSSGKLRDLYDYLLTSLDDAGRDLAFGRSADGGTYHELRTPYAIYVWELCFHAPMLLADRLVAAKQFDEALAVLHTIVNPFAKGTAEDPIWRFAPFQTDTSDNLDDVFLRLGPDQHDNDVSEWRDDPFNPHLVARGRPAAYKRQAAIAYVNAWIAYGDFYFQQNTLETVPSAIQCYVVASHVLGPRGQEIPQRGRTQPRTYRSLLDSWDAFSNALVDLEIAFPYSNQSTAPAGAELPTANIFGSAASLYFCIPSDPAVTQLRDTIDQRLTNIRQCRDINGVYTPLPLFEARIDPGLLVEAAAQGLNLASVLGELNAPTPDYRFTYLLQKALDACRELQSLGGALASAREKGDAEALSRLRTTHEVMLNNLVLDVRRRQLDEATSAIEALEQSRLAPVARLRHQLRLIGEDLTKLPTEDADFTELPDEIDAPVDSSGLKLSAFENEEVSKASTAQLTQLTAGIVEALSGALHAAPDLNGRLTPFGVGAGTSWGGTNLGNMTQAVARGIQVAATDLSAQAGNAGRKAGLQRQLQDRILQANSAGYEIKNIDRQILTQKIRADIATKELANQQTQVDNSQAVLDFLASKYSNTELYSYLGEQLSGFHYQSYTLAFELAKQAEQLYRLERCQPTAGFIEFGYWDANRDGLLAGERLQLALRQLERAYLAERGHDYELVKAVSLRQLNPLALIELRENGSCEFSLPEAMVDMDFTGHYKRQIKSVSLLLPCTVGPYTGLNATVRLLAHRTRISADAKNAADYAESTTEPDARFITTNIPITAMAVSTSDMEAGVFELSLGGERHLPFEGAGLISTWRVELPTAVRQFDYDTINDLILRIRYTSSDGGEGLRAAAEDSVAQFVKSVEDLSRDQGLLAVFDIRNDFPDAWYAGLNPPAAATERVLALTGLPDRLPLFTRRAPGHIVATDVYLYVAGSVTSDLIAAGQSGTDITFTAAPAVGDLTVLAAHDVGAPMGDLTITITDRASTVDRLLVVERYTLS